MRIKNLTDRLLDGIIWGHLVLIVLWVILFVIISSPLIVTLLIVSKGIAYLERKHYGS